MPKLYRIVAFAIFTVFIAAAVGHVYNIGRSAMAAEDPPQLLPAAFAVPADVEYSDTLQAGETLSELLARAELAQDEAAVLLSALTEHQDPRRLAPGFSISFRRSYLNGLLRHIEMRLDADHTLEVRREGETWTESIEEVPVTGDTLVIAGEVRSSLYQALLESDDVELPTAERERIVDILADQIFAWRVDFSRDLREGDRFRVLYERMVRPDGSARSGRVLGVQFTINGADYEAYWFEAGDGTADYFDRRGRSLRSAFLKAPLQYRRISSAFSTGRFHPVLKRNRAHHGIDYAANTGTPIRATGDGVIRRAGWAGGYGNLVEIRHMNGYSTRYAHMRGFARGIRPGVRVKQGDVIGYVGSTGLSTGPHLHYEFRDDGRPVDPNGIQFLRRDPVPDRYKDEFQALVGRQVALLDRGAEPVLLADARASGSATRAD